VGLGFYEAHREVIQTWRASAVWLYERWSWTQADVLDLTIDEFSFYVDVAKDIFEAEKRVNS
jgi:hypothetical protein